MANEYMISVESSNRHDSRESRLGERLPRLTQASRHDISTIIR